MVGRETRALWDGNFLRGFDIAQNDRARVMGSRFLCPIHLDTAFVYQSNIRATGVVVVHIQLEARVAARPKWQSSLGG